MVAAISTAGLAAACAVIDSVDPRHDSINRAAARARNEAILLNIVRAGHKVPLNFVAFSKISGAHNVGGSAGLPQFGLGPEPLVFTVNRQAVFGSSVLSGSTSINNNFDVTILESRDFYSGLLSPVDLPTLNFFIRQGYSRQLLFWLFTDSVRETIAGRTYEYRNDPDPEISCDDFRGGRRCFRDMVDIALATGLTAQTQKAAGAGRGSIVYGRLCFDPVLVRQARREYADEIFVPLVTTTGHRPRCTEPWPSEESRKTDGSTDTLTFEVTGSRFGPISYSITTRSTFGIYRFLGRILETQSAESVRLRQRKNEDEDTRILAVGSESSDGCFVDVRFGGRLYCVPWQGADNTKHIFSLLAQLLALRTQPGDLAITPTVRVQP
jgi:hypothetical protein